MQRRLRDLNAGWARRGLPEIAIGIGVSSGPMSVGNMGSQRRFDYTVVGDMVNLGARLEALTKEYGAAILVGERVARAAGDGFVFRELDLVRLKGKDQTVRVYELVGEAGVAAAAVDMAGFADALAAYRERRFADAAAGFAAIAAARPEDAPARVLAGRAQELGATPPPDDWDGVYEQRSK
jgi:adenylate cyclase